MGQSREKRIKMILKEGTLSGWVFADDGRVELTHCSRTDAADKAFQKQMKNKPGVYILYSDTELYAGRSTDISERIGNHLAEKAFWKKVVVFSRKAQMDPTMLTLCEGELIERSQNLIGMKCLNKKGKDPANVDAFQESEAKEFLEEAILLMNMVGIRFFEDRNAALRRRLLEGTRRKAEAIQYLAAYGSILGEHIYYCSNATNHDRFDVDVDRDVADKCTWTLISNNVTTRTLLIMSIPARFLDGVHVRKDTDKYTLKIKASDFLTNGTGKSLTEYLIQKVIY